MHRTVIAGRVVAIMPRPTGHVQLTIETDRPLVVGSRKQIDNELYPWFTRRTWRRMVERRGGQDNILLARVAYDVDEIRFEDGDAYKLRVGDGPSDLTKLLRRSLKRNLRRAAHRAFFHTHLSRRAAMDAGTQFFTPEDEGFNRQPITSAEEVRDGLVRVIRASFKFPGWTVSAVDGEFHSIRIEHKKSGEAYSVSVRPAGSNSPNHKP